VRPTGAMPGREPSRECRYRCRSGSPPGLLVRGMPGCSVRILFGRMTKPTQMAVCARNPWEVPYYSAVGAIYVGSHSKPQAEVVMLIRRKDRGRIALRLGTAAKSMALLPPGAGDSGLRYICRAG
jgi:hypothetical protein